MVIEFIKIYIWMFIDAANNNIGVLNKCRFYFKRWTLGWNDLIIFKCFRVIFSLKRKLSNFRFRLIFIFNKREPQSCQFATYQRNALFEFLMSQTGKMAFPNFKVITRLLCVSLTHLPKAVCYFEKTL